VEIYQQHEKEKDKYNQRVIDIEKIPLSLQQVVGWHQNALESTKDLLKRQLKNAGSHMHLS